MNHFISCDWGTSSFRLRLIDTGTKAVLAEIKSAQGIAGVYTSWKEQVNTERISFYCNIILSHVLSLEQEYKYSLNDIPIVISGMASSSIGMMELPYQSVPFNINKTELVTSTIPATETWRHTMIVISGICSSNDVMRGEETMLAGCDIATNDKEQLFIFPGTHSKHVTFENGILKDFKTYMTGELFDLLSNNSILTTSIETGDTENNKSFLRGVQDAATSSLLNNIFHVRTNYLFERLTKKENYHYLSGLLVGEELKNIQAKNYDTITIVSTGVLLKLYLDALSAMGFKETLLQNADEALIKGQAHILRHYQ